MRTREENVTILRQTGSALGVCGQLLCQEKKVINFILFKLPGDYAIIIAIRMCVRVHSAKAEKI